MAHFGKVVTFQKLGILRPAQNGASIIDIAIGRARELLGRILNRLRIPGAVKDIYINDALTGQEIKIHVGVLITRLSVNGRDYFFHRLSGKLVGTGMGCD